MALCSSKTEKVTIFYQSSIVNVKSEMEKVHAVCFARLCDVIDREIIVGKKIKKMIDLRSFYSTYLSETPFANPNYRSGKINSLSNSHEIYSN